MINEKELKRRVKEKLDADPSFSSTYRGKVMAILESVIKELGGT